MPARTLSTGIGVSIIPEENIYSHGDQTGKYDIYRVADEFLVCTFSKDAELNQWSDSEENVVFNATPSSEPLPQDRTFLVETAPGLFFTKDYTMVWVRGQAYTISFAEVFFEGVEV